MLPNKYSGVGSPSKLGARFAAGPPIFRPIPRADCPLLAEAAAAPAGPGPGQQGIATHPKKKGRPD